MCGMEVIEKGGSMNKLKKLADILMILPFAIRAIEGMGIPTGNSKGKLNAALAIIFEAVGDIAELVPLVSSVIAILVKLKNTVNPPEAVPAPAV